MSELKASTPAQKVQAAISLGVNRALSEADSRIAEATARAVEQATAKAEAAAAAARTEADKLRQELAAERAERAKKEAEFDAAFDSFNSLDGETLALPAPAPLAAPSVPPSLRGVVTAQDEQAHDIVLIKNRLDDLERNRPAASPDFLDAIPIGSLTAPHEAQAAPALGEVFSQVLALIDKQPREEDGRLYSGIVEQDIDRANAVLAAHGLHLDLGGTHDQPASAKTQQFICLCLAALTVAVQDLRDGVDETRAEVANLGGRDSYPQWAFPLG